MGFHLHMLMATGRLAGLEDQIRQAVGRVETALEGIVDLHPTDVIVADQPKQTIPDLGIGGFCGNAHLISVALNPDHAALDFSPAGAFDRTLVHEVHHALRWAEVGYGHTLGGALVSEGLAGHFVKQVFGTPPESWEAAVSGDALNALTQEAITAWDDENYDHGAWFFGTAGKAQWGGFTIGYQLVADYLAAHAEETAAGLVGADPNRFKPT